MHLISAYPTLSLAYPILNRAYPIPQTQAKASYRAAFGRKSTKAATSCPTYPVPAATLYLRPAYPIPFPAYPRPDTAYPTPRDPIQKSRPRLRRTLHDSKSEPAMLCIQEISLTQIQAHRHRAS